MESRGVTTGFFETVCEKNCEKDDCLHHFDSFLLEGFFTNSHPLVDEVVHRIASITKSRFECGHYSCQLLSLSRSGPRCVLNYLLLSASIPLGVANEVRDHIINLLVSSMLN